jgi:hypothetical protein
MVGKFSHHLSRKISTAISLLKERGLFGLLKPLIGLERFVVYSADPATVAPPEEIPNACLFALSVNDLRELAHDCPDVQLQLDYVQRHGFISAYAVRFKGHVAHISWVMTAELECNYPIKNVKLRPGEVEITHCVTFENFRGQSLYPYAIRSICQLEAARGTKRVFMITNCNNLSSQRGMQKAGLYYNGGIARIIFPQLPTQYYLTLRGHRWTRSQ